jgi:hypothetical protein
MPFHKCSCGRWTNYATTCIECSRSPLDEWETHYEEEPDPYYEEYGTGYEHLSNELEYDEDDD